MRSRVVYRWLRRALGPDSARPGRCGRRREARDRVDCEEQEAPAWTGAVASARQHCISRWPSPPIPGETGAHIRRAHVSSPRVSNLCLKGFNILD